MTTVNMMDALNGFDEALRGGRIKTHRLMHNDKVHIHADTPAPNQPRITFARLKGSHVTAVVVLTAGDPYEGAGCFHMGYAVREDQRGKGLAKALVADALKDIVANMSNRGMTHIWVEASVDSDNPASAAVARSVLGVEPTDKSDPEDGRPLWHFIKRLDLS